MKLHSNMLCGQDVVQEGTEGTEMEGQHKRMRDSGNARYNSPLSPCASRIFLRGCLRVEGVAQIFNSHESGFTCLG